VIGGGMAGSIAALRAKSKGAQVTLCRHSLGATALSSGAVDVAPDPAAPPGDLKSQLVSPELAAREIARTRPNHPYAILVDKLDRLKEALSFAAAVLPEILCPPLARNALLPTPLGTVKPAGMAQPAHAGADLAALPESIAVVQLSVNPSFDAQLVARGLEQSASLLGRKLTAVVIESHFFRNIEDALRGCYELAELLERPGAIDEFARDLRPRLPEAVGALLLPPIIGRHGSSLVAELSKRLGGLPCSEVLSTAPSVPGIRLQEGLDSALVRAGIPVIESEVTCSEPGSGLFTLGGGETIEPGAVVLATGKFIGGGIVRAERFFEPLLDLPLFAGSTRASDQYIGDLLAENVQGKHQAFRVGVRIDSSLRPLNANGGSFDPRLFAAGSVISGYDPAADKTGLGVAIFTGYLAGEAAASLVLLAR
jgi:glycerol-3-phosphate dehydrogenase subunit B